jgi:hypothetical protein
MAKELELAGFQSKPVVMDEDTSDAPFIEIGNDGNPYTPPADAAATKAKEALAKGKEPTWFQRLAIAPPFWVVATAAKWFVMEDSFSDSDGRPKNDPREIPYVDSNGKDQFWDAIPVWRVLLVGVMLKVLAFFGAALVGVSLGLAVSAWVRSATQAVMWVPLLLIPQILFGGYVVTLPKMSALVRAISTAFPSHACQRIIDVSNLYGRSTPSVTNLTKHPVFLTGGAGLEEIFWVNEQGDKISESYHRESYVNTSWQNLAVVPERVGQRKKVEEAAGTVMVKRETVAFRGEEKSNPITGDKDRVPNTGDVRYSKGTPFLNIFPAEIAMWILIGWICFCYGFALLGIQRKTHG